MVEEHACVMHSVIGWRSIVGAWSRVEGIPLAPNPNVPFAKVALRSLPPATHVSVGKQTPLPIGWPPQSVSYDPRK